jgi:hypothetical protein
MNEEALHRDLFLLVGYLLTSAHGLYDEPKGYGPFRLLDAAGRLLVIMEAHGLSDPFLRQLEHAVAAERFGHGDDEQLRTRLNELCLESAAELKRRTSPKEGGS